MEFNIHKTVDTKQTERAKNVMKDFDIKLEHSNENFVGNIEIDNIDWNIGLIVGGSGTRKTTIAKELFKNGYVYNFNYDDNSVLDNMPEHCSVEQIEHVFTSVGFSSPPSWLKPYKVLSTGEKMRVDLARAILCNEFVVFDEFTSVVDRDVAKTCSIAIQKQIRRDNKKFVAISCHKDIIECLSPDWIYDTDQKCFFAQRGNMSSPNTKLTYIKLVDLIKNKYGQYLGSIII